MATVHSYKGRLEIQTDGVSGSGGYNALNHIGDAVMTSSRSSAFTPKRGTEFKFKLTGQSEVGITAQMTWDDADTVVAAIESAHFNNTHVGVKFLDKASGTGITLDMLVEEWAMDQSEDGAQMVNLTFVPTYVDTDPAWA